MYAGSLFSYLRTWGERAHCECTMIFIAAAPGTDSGSGTFSAISWLPRVHSPEQSLVPPVGSPGQSRIAAPAAGVQPQSPGLQGEGLGLAAWPRHPWVRGSAVGGELWFPICALFGNDAHLKCLTGQELGRLGPTLEGGWSFPRMTNHLNLSGLSTVTKVPEIEGKSASHCCNFLLDLHFEPILIYRDGSSQS